MNTMPITTTTINSIVEMFERQYSIALRKLPRKQIIYGGSTASNKSVIVAMPASKIYARGNGWIDFTKVQIDLFKQYTIAIAIFRLDDGTNYYVTLVDLLPLLSKDNMMVNSREGEHWKIDIWPTKLTLRNGGQSLCAHPNRREILDGIL